MELKLHDTQTREKRVFTPLDKTNVRMYVCGPTVYNPPHIGNARPVVIFDILFRLLRLLYGEEQVAYIRNITDIDDKIITAAKQQNITITQLARSVEKQFHTETEQLLCLPVTASPRATDHINEMQKLVQALLAKNIAYIAEKHVLFNVARQNDYGALSKRQLSDMIAGARVEVAPYKQNPHDFVLWKPSAPDEPGWDSPWGRGRPGWHLECSAMSAKFLGTTFDIHGGGIDLLFPHHENERAQTCAASGEKIMANFWIHNGYVVRDNEKMSKSLGNVLLTSDLLQQFDGETVRLALLSGHYRQPLDITTQKLQETKTQLDRLYRVCKPDAEVRERAASAKPDAEFLAALLDDLNTPKAIARLHTLAAEIVSDNDKNSGAVNVSPGTEESPSAVSAADKKVALLAAANLVGLLSQNPDTRLGYIVQNDADAARLLAEREDARRRNDFAKADEIRASLASLGYQIEDTPAGPRLRRLSEK
ncbi:MAG: cysteine--tRNA ligase [Alphaproteobacteria bacterium]|nr:cysteine--tRNA ligase [Alphaproteobacteria bacterium]